MRLAEGQADLKANQAKFQEAQTSIKDAMGLGFSRIQDIGRMWMVERLIYLPETIFFIFGYYFFLYMYLWYKRINFVENFVLDCILKFLCSVFYPVTSIVLCVMWFRDIYQMRFVRRRPDPPAMANSVSVSSSKSKMESWLIFMLFQQLLSILVPYWLSVQTHANDPAMAAAIQGGSGANLLGDLEAALDNVAPDGNPMVHPPSTFVPVLSQLHERLLQRAPRIHRTSTSDDEDELGATNRQRPFHVPAVDPRGGANGASTTSTQS